MIENLNQRELTRIEYEEGKNFLLPPVAIVTEIPHSVWTAFDEEHYETPFIPDEVEMTDYGLYIAIGTLYYGRSSGIEPNEVAFYVKPDGYCNPSQESNFSEAFFYGPGLNDWGAALLEWTAQDAKSDALVNA